eukprot:gb/GECH01009196.1/.p1 GENE.gb/GECH01009196.1/~~gb/GECH01009196.1/.p1  ORF type:complete len:302 (+),score=67.55 gb/GECH01009196.1/:1-906(+)
MKMETLDIKVYFEDSPRIKRFCLTNSDINFTTLQNKIFVERGNNSSEYWITYLDNEGEWVSIENIEDFNNAILFYKDPSQPLLRLKVFKHVLFNSSNNKNTFSSSTWATPLSLTQKRDNNLTTNGTVMPEKLLHEIKEEHQCLSNKLEYFMTQNQHDLENREQIETKCENENNNLSEHNDSVLNLKKQNSSLNAQLEDLKKRLVSTAQKLASERKLNEWYKTQLESNKTESNPINRNTINNNNNMNATHTGFKVSYNGWGSEWNEIVPHERLKKNDTTPFQVGDAVLVLWGDQWWSGTILA